MVFPQGDWDHDRAISAISPSSAPACPKPPPQAARPWVLALELARRLNKHLCPSPSARVLPAGAGDEREGLPELLLLTCQKLREICMCCILVCCADWCVFFGGCLFCPIRSCSEGPRFTTSRPLRFVAESDVEPGAPSRAGVTIMATLVECAGGPGGACWIGRPDHEKHMLLLWLGPLGLGQGTGFKAHHGFEWCSSSPPSCLTDFTPVRSN